LAARERKEKQGKLCDLCVLSRLFHCHDTENIPAVWLQGPDDVLIGRQALRLGQRADFLTKGSKLGADPRTAGLLVQPPRLGEIEMLGDIFAGVEFPIKRFGFHGLIPSNNGRRDDVLHPTLCVNSQPDYRQRSGRSARSPIRFSGRGFHGYVLHCAGASQPPRTATEQPSTDFADGTDSRV